MRDLVKLLVLQTVQYLFNKLKDKRDEKDN